MAAATAECIDSFCNAAFFVLANSNFLCFDMWSIGINPCMRACVRASAMLISLIPRLLACMSTRYGQLSCVTVRLSVTSTCYVTQHVTISSLELVFVLFVYTFQSSLYTFSGVRISIQHIVTNSWHYFFYYLLQNSTFAKNTRHREYFATKLMYMER